MRRPLRRRDVALAVLFAVGLFLAPTVGDVGSCGAQATDLDEAVFAQQRKALDCQRCKACGLDTNTCKSACNPAVPSDVSFPPTCRPLAEDGVVCIDALQAASCDDYATYVADVAPAVPTECDFCHVTAPTAAPVGDF